MGKQMKQFSVQCATAALLLVVNSSATAGEQLARLTVEVTVEGAKQWRDGSNYSNTTISEKYHLMTHVQASGEPTSVNTKDPHYAQQQMAKAGQVQQALREAQARAGAPVPKAAATEQEYIEQQKALAENMQKGQVACAGDMACLMKLSQEYAQQAAMQSYPPASGTPTAAVEQDDDTPEEERYLDYFGYEGCPGDIHIVINNTSEGATADVSGMVPFEQADTADYRGNDLNLKMQCLSSTLVYDMKAKKIYTDGIGHPAPRGSYRYWDRLHGETLNADTDVPTTAIAWEWVAGNLRLADAVGSASTTLPISQDNAGAAPPGLSGEHSQVSGQLKVDMRWRFEPL